MRPNTRPSYIYYIVLAIAFVLFGAMFYLHPYTLDDEWFLSPMSAFKSDPTIANFFSGWRDSIIEHFTCDNGRIGNMIGSALLAGPRWLIAIILGTSVALAIFVLAKVAGAWKKNLMIFCGIVFLYMIALPWHDFMFMRMYSLNYQIPTFLAFGTLGLVLNVRLSKWWWALIAGLLVSAWHEAFGAPLLAAVVMLMIFKPRYRTRTNCILCAALLCGIIYLALVPGTRVRSGDFNLFHGFAEPLRALHLGILFLAYIVMFVVALCFHKWRNRLDYSTHIALLTIGFVSWIIWRTFFNGARITWCLEAASVAGIANLAFTFPHSLRPRILRAAVEFILLLVPISLLALAIPYLAKLNRHAEAYCELVNYKPGVKAFYTYPEPWEQPLYLLERPNPNLLIGWSRKTSFAIPETLRNYNPELAIPLPGDNGGARLWDNHYVVLPFREDISDTEGPAIYTIGTPSEIYTYYLTFTADSGKKYIFCRPYLLLLSQAHKPISGFSFDPDDKSRVPLEQ